MAILFIKIYFHILTQDIYLVLSMRPLLPLAQGHSQALLRWLCPDHLQVHIPRLQLALQSPPVPRLVEIAASAVLIHR